MIRTIPLLVLLFAATPAFACGGNPVCTVADPTGTPLNIRLGPNDTILGTAKNGTKLEFIDHVEHNGKRWARVARFDANAAALSEGGVFLFAAYLDCLGDVAKASDEAQVVCRVADPTGTPLNVRLDPNGEILGSVRNGETVRVFATKRHNGKLWAQAWRDPSDNAIGWVFDDYMLCEEDGH
ncbi:MAG TPA: SH3 domain-containing protein [Rhizobiaceae bacterium]|nr:SH3 domain-containing protein [Rhizobiaceae bacterium]